MPNEWGHVCCGVELVLATLRSILGENLVFGFADDVVVVIHGLERLAAVEAAFAAFAAATSLRLNVTKSVVALGPRRALGADRGAVQDRAGVGRAALVRNGGRFVCSVPWPGYRAGGDDAVPVEGMSLSLLLAEAHRQRPTAITPSTFVRSSATAPRRCLSRPTLGIGRR